MKKYRFLSLICAVALTPLALSAAAVDSHINAVTVYPDRAVITRTGSAGLTNGINELVFENLPAGLLDQSLQVSGTGSINTTILDVTARQTYLAATPDPRRQGLEDQIDALREKDRAVIDRITVVRGQTNLITQLQSSAVAIGPGEKSERPKLDDVKSVLEYGQKQLLELAAQQQQLDNQRADLQAEIAALQNQLNDLRGTGARSVKTVVVRVQATGTGTFNASLNYTVYGASWTPSYDARVLSGEKAVELGYFGNVRQSTGEDWSNVALTLSTARPALGGSAPDLGVWNLDLWKERPQIQTLEMPAAKSAFRVQGAWNDASATRIGMEIQSAPAQATVESGTTSATFKIAVPSSVPSDNTAQKVPVTSARLNAITEYNTTPKLQETAFLNARVVNTTDYPLLAGQMNVFLDGTFVATSRLDTTMPKEKFELALGADEGISVEHKRVNKFTEEKGVFSKDHKITYEYLTTIQNNKQTAQRIIVTDQVPVSRNEKIVVKVQSPPEKDLKPNADGELKWTLNLQPGEKRELKIKFTVEYPQDIKIDGLE